MSRRRRARRPSDVHVVIRADVSALQAAWARLEATQDVLDAIRPCPSMHPGFAQDVYPVACALTAGHEGRHRDRGSIVKWD